MGLSRRLFVTGAALSLTGCGAPRGQQAELMRPAMLAASNYRADGIPARFGDTDPHGWEGLTPASLPVHGIDAARYQGEIDWHRARGAGVSFAWLKATEGGDHSDPGFRVNAALARGAGVPVGAYHFYYFCRSPEEQARWYIRNVPRRAGDLPPVLDIEWNHTSPSCRRRPAAREVRAEMRRFLAIVNEHYGTRPVIYTTVDFWRDNGLEQFPGYEFWLRSVAGHPMERYPGAQWSFWQYSGTGVVPGVPGTVDMNAFAGSPGAWEGWLARRAQRG
ncbi:glycoside hydrolase [Thioclava marina]|uniref:Glycoside hydrolase n=1 Tax=Thioclava marina TaxID=1915077 RepID=A0ABX3MNN4_9RHOB|nr:glycoside hydrolase [Thioclava marina]